MTKWTRVANGVSYNISKLKHFPVYMMYKCTDFEIECIYQNSL